MIIAVENVPLHRPIQVQEIADHARALIYLRADSHLHVIVVTVPIRIVALAIDGAVFLSREFIVMKPVRSRKQVTAGQVRFHASPSKSKKQTGGPSPRN